MPLCCLRIGKSLTKVRTGAPMMLSTTTNKRHHGTALAFKTRLCSVGSQEGCVNDSRVYSVVCWLGLLSCQRKESVNRWTSFYVFPSLYTGVLSDLYLHWHQIVLININLNAKRNKLIIKSKSQAVSPHSVSGWLKPHKHEAVLQGWDPVWELCLPSGKQGGHQDTPGLLTHGMKWKGQRLACTAVLSSLQNIKGNDLLHWYLRASEILLDWGGEWENIFHFAFQGEGECIWRWALIITCWKTGLVSRSSLLQRWRKKEFS